MSASASASGQRLQVLLGDRDDRHFLVHLDTIVDKIKLCRACQATIRTMKAEGACIMDEGVAATTLVPSWLYDRVQQALKLK